MIIIQIEIKLGKLIDAINENTINQLNCYRIHILLLLVITFTVIPILMTLQLDPDTFSSILALTDYLFYQI